MHLLLERTYTDIEGALPLIREAIGEVWADVEEGTLAARRKESAARRPPHRTRHYVQLIVHEWIANLVRHATFSGPPQIRIRLLSDDVSVQCEITDNSRGFDLDEALSNMKSDAAPLPEAGMGLRIIDACTSNVSYRNSYGSDSSSRYSFVASVPYDHDPWMNVLF